MSTSTFKHILTFEIEDWFHFIDVPRLNDKLTLLGMRSHVIPIGIYLSIDNPGTCSGMKQLGR
jgi:hypothetical protein